jgi:hypothetical protein
MGSPASPLSGQPTPPPGYQLDVTPPDGYHVDPAVGYGDVPAFLQQGIDMSKVRQVVTPPSQEEKTEKDIAGVNSDDPYTVRVLAPDLYGKPVLNHELVHTFQDIRNKSLPPISRGVNDNDPNPYDYGGPQGLQAAAAHHKTIADFNSEQQAEIVKDYKVYHDAFLRKAASKKSTPEDARQMYILQQAYHPFIQQLAGIPGQDVNLDRSPILELLGVQNPVDIRSSPKPPGLPRYDTPGLGVLPADPLLGGKSQAIPVGKSGSPRKYPVGEPTPLPKIIANYVGAKFPAYSDYLSKVVIHPGTTSPEDDRQVETYMPWEDENPNPGKLTIQPFHKSLTSDQALPNMVAGEMLHYIGGIDESTGKPVDPSYYNLKQQVKASRTPHQAKIDDESYKQAQKSGETRSFDKWFDESRGDEYIMGYVAPDKNREWINHGWYKDPKMAKAVEDVRKYLTTPKKKTESVKK